MRPLWRCPVCANRYWFWTKSCRPCSLMVMRAVANRVMDAAMREVVRVYVPGPSRKTEELN